MLKDTAEEKEALARATAGLRAKADRVMYLMNDLHKTVELWSRAVGQENIKKIIVNEKGKGKQWVYSQK